MGILDKLRHGAAPAGGPDPRHVSATIERVAQLQPQLRLARRYAQRLAPAAATALGYIGDMVAAIPPPREASAAAWSTDPYLHAYFVSGDEVAQVISRSADLRAHFAAHGAASEAFAVLGMEMTERHVLGVGLQGDTLRRDVPQTTVSFSDHQVRMCGHTEAELRTEIVRRMMEQLALEGLALTAADKSRRDQLERERALLKTRLQLLEHQGAGIRAVLGSEASLEAGEQAQLAAQLADNEQQMAGLGMREDALDRELEHVRAVFAEPARHLYVETRRLRLDRMNVILDQHSTQAGDDFEFRVARLPTTPPRMRAFTLIRFARADLLPEKNKFEEAAQLLASGLYS
jgi:hypothetical protein